MKSPYFNNNVGGGWGVPAGLAQMLQADADKSRQGAQDLGNAFQKFGEQYEARKEKEKNRAREFKSLQEYADVAGYATKDQTTTMDLDTLKGLVRGKEAKTLMAEQATKQQEAQSKLAEMAQLFEMRQQEMQADSAFAKVARNAGERVPAVATPGMFGGAVAPAGNFGPVTPQSMVSAMLDQPESFNSRGAAPFLRQLAEQQGNDPSRQMFAEANQMNAKANLLDAQRRSTAPAPTAAATKPTVTVEDVVNGKNVRRQLTEEQFTAWQGANPDKAIAGLRDKLSELKAAKAAGKKTVDLKQLMKGGGIDLSPWWGGKPIDDGIAYLETKLGGAAPASSAAIPPEHAAYLKAHPEKRASFAKQYGEAAAAAILGE